LIAADRRGPRPMILCAAQVENHVREIAITRRAGRQKRFAAAVLHATKVC
jgi:hypothetical protein